MKGALLFCAVALSAQHAQAHRYPGGHCREVTFSDGEPWTTWPSVEGFYNGAELNTNAIVCPVLRLEGFTDYTVAKITTTASDGDTTCTFHSTEKFLDAADYVTKTIPSGTNTVTWAANEVESYDKGYYSFLCDPEDTTTFVIHGYLVGS